MDAGGGPDNRTSAGRAGVCPGAVLMCPPPCQDGAPPRERQGGVSFDDEQQDLFVKQQNLFAPTERRPGHGGGHHVGPAVVLPPLARINEAIERLRQVGLPHPSMNSLLCGGGDYTLLGVLGLRDMLPTRGRGCGWSGHDRPFATITAGGRSGVAAQLMEAFDLLDAAGGGQRQPPGGRVTADEAMGVLQEEATEDMEMMAAITPRSALYGHAGVVRIFAKPHPLAAAI